MDIEIVEGSKTNIDAKVGIVVSRWNSFVTDKLLDGALDTLKTKGFNDEQIIAVRCPGAFEIPFTSRSLLPKVDGIIALGAIIRGETPHFDYICQAATEGILKLDMENDKPVIFGVLTTDTVQQANERANKNSKFGNKGAEAALAVIEMISLGRKLQ